jgi:hypothetical protein
VEWEDAWVDADGPWVDQEACKPMEAKIFRQLGFLLEDNDDCIVLTHAMEGPGKGLMASRERIPRGMVRSITELAPKRGRK